MKTRLLTLALGMMAVTRPIGAKETERLVLNVTPAVSFAPANLVVRATIATDADNRSVEIVADSANFYRSSAIQLEGDRAPRTTYFQFRSLPPGVYEVRAVLKGSDGHDRAQVRTTVNVVSAGGPGN